MPDEFASHQPGLTAPAANARPITPADGVALAAVPRAVYVGGAGSLSTVMLSGDSVTFAQMQAGMIYPLRLREVRATGTTASGLIALF